MEPRFLTEDEIENIISKLENIKIVNGLLEQVNELANKSILRNMRNQMRLYKLAPEKIPRLIEELTKNLTITVFPDGSVRDTKVQEGTFVGVTATEAFCQPVTQMIMKSFHVAGSAVSAGEATRAIKEITSASKNRKSLWTRIYFKKDLSYDQAYSLIPDIVSTTLKNLIKYTEVLFYKEPEWWYSQAPLSGKSPTLGQVFVRLHLDKTMVLERKISMRYIAESIEKTGVSLRVMYSPISLGTIDIIPIPEQVRKYCIENFMKSGIDCNGPEIEMMYIDTFILGKIVKGLHLKGVRFINSMIPYIIPILGATIQDEVFRDGKWMVLLDRKRMARFCIEMSRVVKIFVAGGFTVEIDQDFLVLSGMENSAMPTKTILEAAEKDPELKKLCNLVYAETSGTNLRTLFLNPEIDSSRTISNDFVEVSSLFGIECCRLQMMRELNDLIKEREEINDRHVLLLGDLMTHIGELTPINYNGVAKQQVGVIAKVAYERGYATLSANAGMGASDIYLDKNLVNVCPTSTSILTGQMFSKIKNVEVKPIDVLAKLKQLKGQGLFLNDAAEEIIQNEGFVEKVEVEKEKEIEKKVEVEKVETLRTENIMDLMGSSNIITLSQIEADHAELYKLMAAERPFVPFAYSV